MAGECNPCVFFFSDYGCPKGQGGVRCFLRFLGSPKKRANFGSCDALLGSFWSFGCFSRIITRVLISQGTCFFIFSLELHICGDFGNGVQVLARLAQSS